jgi:LiaF transmembrane domain/Cell wall-active antibiotics response LiaF, C-terminal
MTDGNEIQAGLVRPRLTPQLLLGLLIIGAGLLFTLENLGVLEGYEYARYWPVGLIAIGLLKLWQSREGTGGAFGGFIFTLAGIWLLLEQTAVIRISFRDMWPMLLVFFGTYLVWQGVTSRRRVLIGDGNSSITAVAILGGVVRGSNSRTFRGGDLTAILGGCEIDLRQAAINGDAVIEVFALWGGIEIRVPEGWSVSTRVGALLGGVEDKTRAPQGASTHRLTLNGFAIMGGVEIKN